MAFITAETRSSIVELAMGMLNQAPSSELLTTLIGKSTAGASLQDLADYIATTDAFTAEYPATQTAREFATEMFGKLITGGTLDADINTAVIDLLEGLLIAGTTKAEGFVAVINFLADSANADHPDLGDIAQAFQNRADAAEYYSVTKELGDSSDAELAAAIALVTSDAATLTAANAAADATASAATPVASQTLTLTTGVDDIKGTVANETINATAVSPTTGAAVTNLSSGDKIDGGAGTDTLNITLTAANNSLTGVSVSNVEVVNITGANNTATSSSAPASANAGAKQVQVLDIANMSLEAEQQTISYVGLAKNTTAGTLSLSVLGQTVTTESIAANADAATIATAVAAAINASAATPAAAAILGAAAADTVKGLVTATATSGVVTLKYAVKLGDAAATTQANTGLVAAGTTTATAPTITETVTSSAELQDLDLDTWVKKGAGTAEVSVLGTTVTTASIADNAADTVVATAVATAINAAAATSGGALEGKVYATTNGDNVLLTYAASVGNAAAAEMQLDLAAAAGVAVFDDGAGTDKAADAAAGETRKGGEVDLTLSVNGANYTVTSVVDGGVLSATPATATAAQDTSKNAARTAIKTQLNTVLGDGVTVGDSDEAGEIKLTSKTTGTAIPSITAKGRDSATNLISEDSADAAKVANAEITSASGAVAQQVQYTVAGTIALADTFTLYIDGVSYGTLNPSAASPTGAAASIAAAINTVLGTGTAIAVGGTVTTTAPTAGAPLPVISVSATIAGAGTITRTDLRDNVDVLGTTVTAGAASVAASSFTGAEQIWLVGAASNATALTGVAAGQTAGFSGVTSMANSVTFGATVTDGNVNVSASAGNLSVTGAKMTTLNLSGTGSTGLALTDGSSTDTIKTIAASTSGGTVLDTLGATAITALTQSGKGGVTLKNAGTKLATVATGEGADNIKINTTTAKDNANTAADETVTASVSTGDGADKVTVSTTGTAGLTSVETGAGADTVYVTSVGTGVSTINTGADGDTVDIIGIALGSYPNLSINGGSGTDTVVMAGSGTAFSAVDYLRMNGALSDFEGVKFSSSVAGIDASKLAIGTITGFTFNAGANTITEVGAGQSLTLASVTAAATAATNQPAASNYSGTATALTASAAGYVAGTTGGAPTTVYGGSLDVVSKSDANALEVNGTSATVAVTSTGAATTGITADVTLTTSDIKSLTVNLTSARGAGANVVTEYKASFNAGTIDDAAATLGNTHLESLASVTVTGTGGFTINTGTVDKLLADLTTIDVSGMVAMSELNDLTGEPTATNVSTTAITLNTNVAESVLLGGARDTINTNSTVANPDTITGFTLTPDATTPTTLDTARSDVLNVQTGAGALTFVKFTTTATTYAGALTDAGAVAGAAGANLLFAFGGDTYAYVDTANDGLTDNDLLVKLVGTYDLDLLISAVS